MNNIIDKKIFIIFLLGLFLRFLFFFPFIYKHPERVFYHIDAYSYEFPAIALLEKGEYVGYCPKRILGWYAGHCVNPTQPEIYRTPIYPLYIALHYVIIGYRPELVVFTQNILDGLKVILIYHIGKFIGLSNPYVGAFLYAISPSAIIFAQELMTETMQGFILLIFIMLLFMRVKDYVCSALLGLTAGILSLVHPLWYPFALISPILVLIYTRSLRKFLIAGFFVVLTILPWMVRNWLIWKEIIFRHGSHVFLCEIYMKMERGKWLGKDYAGGLVFDEIILNEASERFGWGVKFNTLDEVKDYQMNLTQELQIGKICRDKIIKNILRYPVEIHIGGFLKSFPPVGIGMLYYVIRGDISPSREETAYKIVPLVLSGRIVDAMREIREKRLGLLPLSWFLIYLFSWILRLLSFMLSFLALIKMRLRFSLLLFFIFFYGTFLMATVYSGQPRRFHTVEPIIFILASSIFSRKKNGSLS